MVYSEGFLDELVERLLRRPKGSHSLGFRLLFTIPESTRSKSLGCNSETSVGETHVPYPHGPSLLVTRGRTSDGRYICKIESLF